MENNSNKSGKPRETVTLILKKKQFVVEKQKLMDKCQYFAALLSANFLEYEQTNHVINYDISPISLQDFIDWIHNDKIAFTSATRYDFEELDRLLSLLKLGILFAADKLIEDITDRLERHFMSPKYAIKIWLLAQELNINVLRDLSLALCLDRFDQLPFNSICELSKEHFLKLIGNINVSATKSHLLDIAQKWMDYHQDFTVPLNIIENKEAKILHGIISCEHNNREQYIHCWDGNDFFELTSFEYPPDIIERCSRTGSSLEGMQITARRYDLYLCGGEYGIGSGIFNKNVWRYSLISKKWILETVMPVERRHMLAVCLKNKLLLVGGVGRNEQKLQTINIYDTYAGVWLSSSAKVPLHVEFPDVPEHIIFNDTLIIYPFMDYIYIYFPDKDVWKSERCFSSIHFEPRIDVPILMLQIMPCYIDVVDREELVLKTITETCNVEGCNCIMKTELYSTTLHMFTIEGEEDLEHRYYLFSKTYYNNDLHLHSIPIRDPKKFRSLILTNCKNSARRFFNLLHPAHLHSTNLDHI
ncbi:uncharacterized protein [Temnothorax nylanderi]|uniref:uncharacterized protein n=1 Tax=Temnothorax nylanderi TaxID=102681 RepID=UPI003A8A5479